MSIFSYIKNNAVKSLAAATSLALLSLLLVWALYNFKPSYSSSPTEIPISVNQPKANSTNLSNTDNAKASDSVDNVQPTLQFLNPEAPCPPQQFSCMAKQNDNIQDQSCPSYKPIWVYFSKDNGTSWMQVGCYATAIDATKALNKAIARGYVKNNKVIDSNNSIVKSDSENKDTTKSVNATSSPPPASSNSIQDIFNNPLSKPAEPEKQNEKSTDKPRVLNSVEPASGEQPTHFTSANEVRDVQVAINEPSGVVPEKENREEKHANLTVRFKLLFGLIPVEKRTYPNEEMQERAIILWKKEQKLLEPDGVINEKYAFKNHNDDTIMHHH